MTEYANGRIPASAVKKISTPGSLRADAAASFERLRAAAKKAGFNMGTSVPSQAYRTYDEQVQVFKANYTLNYAASAKVDKRTFDGTPYWRKPGCVAAAIPGSSNHGEGVALDFQGLGGFGGKGYAWMKAHAREYGWVNPPAIITLGESWHFEYDPDLDQHRVTKRRPHRIGTITAGDTTWRTRLWQQFLVEQGHKVTVDGDLGRDTIAATKAWQKKAGLTADGVVGPKTWYRATQGVKAGAKGARVKIAQRVLGLTGTAVDGIAGTTYTTRAKQLQHWLGVSADADLGKTTITALIAKG